MRTTVTFVLLLAAAGAGAQSLSLTEALAQARHNRPAVHAARLNTERARLAARAAGAYPGPTFGLGQSSQPDLGATDQDLYVSQPLDIFGRVAASRAVGRAQVAMAQTEERQALLELQDEVMRAYVEAVAATRLSAAAEAQRSVAESVHQATRRRFEEGRVPEVQVTRAEIELERAKQSALLRKSALEAALTRLAASVGQSSPVPAVDVSPSLVDPAVSLDGRPDIQALEAKRRLTEAEAATTAKSHLPEIDLVGLRSPWRGDEHTVGVRVQLTWSLNPGRSRDEQAAARKAAEADAKAAEDLRRRAQAELGAVDIEVAAARRQVESLEAVRQAASDLVKKSQVGYSNGYSTLLDVLEATRAVREIDVDLAEAQLRLDLALVHKHTVGGKLVEVAR